jgi:hypothetical protein
MLKEWRSPDIYPQSNSTVLTVCFACFNIEKWLTLHTQSLFIYLLFWHFTLSVEGYCCILSHSRTHTHTHHSIGLLWTRDRPVPEISTLRHETIIRDTLPCPRRDSNPQSRKASGLRPRLWPRCQRDLPIWCVYIVYMLFFHWCTSHYLTR